MGNFRYVISHRLYIVSFLIGETDTAAIALAVTSQVGHDGGDISLVKLRGMTIEGCHRGIVYSRETNHHAFGMLRTNLVGEDAETIGCLQM